jgi:TPR repeat protein
VHDAVLEDEREPPRAPSRDPFYGQDLSGPNSSFAQIEPRSAKTRKDPPLRFERGEPPPDHDPNQTDQFAAVGADDDDDDDAPPKRSWALILGATALGLALAVLGGAVWIYSSGGDIKVVDPGASAKREATTQAQNAQAPSPVPDPNLVAASNAGANGAASNAGVNNAASNAGVNNVGATANAAAASNAAAANNATAANNAAANANAANSAAANAAAANSAASNTSAVQPPAANLAQIEQTCSKGDAHACLDLAERYASGRGIAPDNIRAATSYEKACYLNRLDGCLKAGELYERSATPKKARTMYERACDRRIAQGCELLSRLYRVGIGGPPNARIAEAFKRRACGLGLRDNCR